ncbi:conserved protein of unknown function (plasmid) [Pararobbsia alpina]|uniref:hypothetical protein n=1 Tax=Pararobbsia alpina TaxID=621374 RepID=UPI0039A66E2C
MDREKLYDYLLGLMEHTVHRLESSIAPPKPVACASMGYAYRYAEEGMTQAIIQKLARLVSLSRASRVLHAHGLALEQAAIARLIVESQEDVFFLAFGILQGITVVHKKYLYAFYFADGEDELRTYTERKGRPLISRKDVLDYLAETISPNAIKAATTTTRQIASNGMQETSPFIMEMYGGDPPEFQMNGLLAFQPLRRLYDDLWDYFERVIVSFIVAARAFGDNDLADGIASVSQYFERVRPGPW